ncbi:hypothetical protein CBF23_006995 [Marinomonas agarivorans]|nr:hypothetical protein CBF23_006995 [Marinomonas agarivorans]
MQSMGVSQAEAKIVFILPTPPKGHYAIDAMGHVMQVDTQSIIEQDGNHWRKVLTIMAKLCAPIRDNWRVYRDHELLQQDERIEFEIPTVFLPSIQYFICGGEMQKKLNQERLSPVYVNGKQTVAQCGQIIFCPYLDYRQYPNADIELTRLAIAK